MMMMMNDDMRRDVF